MMSQYMNGATRVKGWNATDKLLDSWADNFNAQLRMHTDRIEKQKTQDKEVTAEVLKCSSMEYAQPRVIRLDYETGSTREVDTSSYEEDETFANLLWHPEDQLNIYQGANCAAENLSIHCIQLGDWGNYDIHRVFSDHGRNLLRNEY